MNKSFDSSNFPEIYDPYKGDSYQSSIALNESISLEEEEANDFNSRNSRNFIKENNLKEELNNFQEDKLKDGQNNGVKSDNEVSTNPTTYNIIHQNDSPIKDVSQFNNTSNYSNSRKALNEYELKDAVDISLNGRKRKFSEDKNENETEKPLHENKKRKDENASNKNDCSFSLLENNTKIEENHPANIRNEEMNTNNNQIQNINHPPQNKFITYKVEEQYRGRPNKNKIFIGTKAHGNDEKINKTKTIVKNFGKELTKLSNGFLPNNKDKLDGINITLILAPQNGWPEKYEEIEGFEGKMKEFVKEELKTLFCEYDQLKTRVKDEDSLKQFNEKEKREIKKKSYYNNKQKIELFLEKEKNEIKKPITALFDSKCNDLFNIYMNFGYDKNIEKKIKIDEKKYGIPFLEIKGFGTYKEYIESSTDEKLKENQHVYRDFINSMLASK